jgi:hypothetical protein
MGIICLTPENRQAPWLLFEAGVLSKAVDSNFVSPFLIGLEGTEVQGPLAQFQATRFTEEEVRRLLETINGRSETPLKEARLERMFSTFWPDLRKELEAIQATDVGQAVSPRPESELLAEVLERVRSIERRMAKGVYAREPSENSLSVSPLETLSAGEQRTLLLSRLQELYKSTFPPLGTPANELAIPPSRVPPPFRPGLAPGELGRPVADKALDHPSDDHEPDDHDPDFDGPPDPQP